MCKPYVKLLKHAILASFFLYCWHPHPGQAQDFEPHTIIISTVTDYINQTLSGVKDKKIIISPLNQNLKLIRCTEPLTSFLPPGVKLSGRTTIGVRCGGHKPWKIYVTANISIFDDVVIADEYILRGSQVSASQIRTEKRNVSTLNRGYFSRPADVIGKIARIPISKEQVVTLHSLAAPKLVQRGKNVTILAKSANVTVKMNGNALSDGHLGERIKVRNLRSRRIVEAEVIDDNLVQVSM